jgi:hypothetical protein
MPLGSPDYSLKFQRLTLPEKSRLKSLPCLFNRTPLNASATIKGYYVYILRSFSCTFLIMEVSCRIFLAYPSTNLCLANLVHPFKYNTALSSNQTQGNVFIYVQ